MLKQLKKLCTVEKDRFGSKQTFILSFRFEGVIVTVRIILDDPSGADVVITNMTTLPKQKRGGGYGCKTIRSILQAARESNLRNIRAVQVQEKSEGFWKKMDFVPLNNQANDFSYREPNT